MKSEKSENSPLVSVIMPVYNYEKYLADAIASVTGQTYKNLEIIIVDDGSTDRSWNIIEDYAKSDKRIKPIRNKKNLRLTMTLNIAIRSSRGKYLARMDGDDIRFSDSIQKGVNFLETHPEVVMVGGAAEICDEDMKRLNDRFYPTSDAEIRKIIFRYSPFCHASIVMRAGVLDGDIYGVDWAEDYDLYFRLGQVGKLANLNQVVYKVRTHRRSISQAKQRLQEKMTLYLRLKAVMEYGFKMSGSDKLYFLAQAGSMYIMPTRFRFWLFNRIRSGNR
ncbi:glycosyltransferase [Candidatus Saccharibacteria bacterium]|nr:glycosyltransferase [Candidatus Saccharibacteria bacterium]